MEMEMQKYSIRTFSIVWSVPRKYGEFKRAAVFQMIFT